MQISSFRHDSHSSLSVKYGENHDSFANVIIVEHPLDYAELTNSDNRECLDLVQPGPGLGVIGSSTGQRLQCLQVGVAETQGNSFARGEGDLLG